MFPENPYRFLERKRRVERFVRILGGRSFPDPGRRYPPSPRNLRKCLIMRALRRIPLRKKLILQYLQETTLGDLALYPPPPWEGVIA
jgi:hypothetical protein